MPIRRRGSLARRHVHRRSALGVDAGGSAAGTGYGHFEDLVAQALDTLPAPFAALLENVAVVIEDEPSAEQLRGGDGDTLYGLYEGTPAVEYAADWVPFPNKITLFRFPLEEDFPDPIELADEVRRTVIHELAHHAGIGEERLRELGYD